jgi:hypothetical protein
MTKLDCNFYLNNTQAQYVPSGFASKKNPQIIGRTGIDKKELFNYR